MSLNLEKFSQWDPFLLLIHRFYSNIRIDSCSSNCAASSLLFCLKRVKRVNVSINTLFYEKDWNDAVRVLDIKNFLAFGISILRM